MVKCSNQLQNYKQGRFVTSWSTMILKWRAYCRGDCPRKKHGFFVNDTFHSSLTNYRQKSKIKPNQKYVFCLHGSHHSNRNHVPPPSAASFSVSPPQQFLRNGGSDELLCAGSAGEVLPRGVVEAGGVRNLEGRRAHELGPRGVHLAHDVWAGLLRGGDDAHGRGPLRSGPVRNHLQAQPAPVRLHDRCWHPHQQDGPSSSQVRLLSSNHFLCHCPQKFIFFICIYKKVIFRKGYSIFWQKMVKKWLGFMIKCQNQGGWYQWEAVPMEEDITTIHTQLWEDVTGLFLLTYISQVVLQLQRLYSMVSSSSRRRSIGARTSSGGGQSEAELLLLPYLFYIISYSNNNHHFLFFQCIFGLDPKLNLLRLVFIPNTLASNHNPNMY